MTRFEPSASLELDDTSSPAQRFLQIETPRGGCSYHALPDTQGFLLLGRSVNADVVLEGDPLLSRWHTAIRVEEEGWVAVDLGSTNGTFVAGERLISRRSLAFGEQVSLGSNIGISVVFEAGEGGPIGLPRDRAQP